MTFQSKKVTNSKERSKIVTVHLNNSTQIMTVKALVATFAAFTTIGGNVMGENGSSNTHTVMSSGAACASGGAAASVEDSNSNPFKTLALVRTVDNPYSPLVP